MKHNFHFDKSTGTMVSNDCVVNESLKDNVNEVNTVESDNFEKPEFDNEQAIISNNSSYFMTTNVVKMKRSNEITSVQLINDEGFPESYLDSESEGILMFREKMDYDVCQITDDRTGKALAYIGGYALQISFNMDELNSLEKVEQCVQGIAKLFRHKIMSQTFSNWSKAEEK